MQLASRFAFSAFFAVNNSFRRQSRVNQLQGRIQLGGAISGRDVNAAQKTISGLLKLLYPNAATPIPDEAMEWAAQLALESRRRVKEQQKRIGAAEFRNTKAPSVYLKQMEDEMGPSALKELLESHLLPTGNDSTLRTGSFVGFLANRQELIWTQIKQVTQ